MKGQLSASSLLTGDGTGDPILLLGKFLLLCVFCPDLSP